MAYFLKLYINTNLMRLYETVFILRPSLGASDINEITKKFTSIIEEMGGRIVKKENWGLRSLSYEVEKSKRGYYIMLKIMASGEIVKKVENTYRIMSDDVMRFLTVKTEDGSLDPSPMMHTADGDPAYQTNPNYSTPQA